MSSEQCCLYVVCEETAGWMLRLTNRHLGPSARASANNRAHDGARTGRNRDARRQRDDRRRRSSVANDRGSGSLRMSRAASSSPWSAACTCASRFIALAVPHSTALQLTTSQLEYIAWRM